MSFSVSLSDNAHNYEYNTIRDELHTYAITIEKNHYRSQGYGQRLLSLNWNYAQIKCWNTHKVI